MDAPDPPAKYQLISQPEPAGPFWKSLSMAVFLGISYLTLTEGDVTVAGNDFLSLAGTAVIVCGIYLGFRGAVFVALNYSPTVDVGAVTVWPYNEFVSRIDAIAALLAPLLLTILLAAGYLMTSGLFRALFGFGLALQVAFQTMDIQGLLNLWGLPQGGMIYTRQHENTIENFAYAPRTNERRSNKTE